jgi:[ribosomal protein S18]-alanine N-acetyltransferase
MNWTIERLVDATDVAGVAEVERRSFSNPWTEEMLAAEVRNAEVAHVYVIRTPEAPVAGYASFWLVFDELHINNVAVSPELRGRGLGTALMEHILRQGELIGGRSATLEVRRSNEDALRLYQRLGFRITGIRPRYYTNPVEDALILWRHELGANH